MIKKETMPKCLAKKISGNSNYTWIFLDLNLPQVVVLQIIQFDVNPDFLKRQKMTDMLDMEVQK